MTNATEAKRQSEIGDVKDQARLDIVSKQTEKLGPEITDEELRTILEEYGTLKGEGDILDQTLVTKSRYEIPVREIWSGSIVSNNTYVADSEKAIKIIVNSGDDGIVQLPITKGAEIDWRDDKTEVLGTTNKFKKLASISNNVHLAALARGYIHEYDDKNKEFEVSISGTVFGINSFAIEC